MSQITQSGAGVQNKRVNFAYNAIGQMQSLQRYSDLGGTQLVAGTSYAYDSLNRLSEINHRNAGGTNLAFYRFGYDAAGRIRQTVDVDGTTDYTYTYDNEGNLKTRTRIGTSEVRTFTWDYRNRLIGVSDSTGGATTYTYDAMNRRISESVGGTTTQLVYDRDNVLLEFTGSAIPSVRYLHGPMVDQVLAQESGGQTSWMLTDQLGSVRDLVNNSGAVVNHFSYDSFGKVVGATGTTDTRYKFTGRELDGETGLYYYRARYYDAGVGRFIGKDPIGFKAGDSNLYRYVGNRATDRVDPSGLLVNMTFEVSKGKLTTVDLDTGRSVVVKAFSGNAPFTNNPNSGDIPFAGTIPLGVFDILQFTPEPNWFRLDIRDDLPRNDLYDDPAIPGFPRGSFRLHLGRVST